MSGLDGLVRKVPRKNIGTGIILCALVIFFSLNILFTPLFNFQLDITRDKSNTISQDTKNMLREIIAPITVKLFYSTELDGLSPIYSNFFGQVKDLLLRYKDEVPDKLSIEIYYMDSLSDLAKTAVNYGLKGIPLGSDLTGYFGIVFVDELENQKVIPVLNPYLFTSLEYDIAKLILNMFTLERPIIGIMSDLPVLGEVNYDSMRGRTEVPPWGFAGMLREFYELVDIPPNSHSIPQELGAIIVINPNTISGYTAYALEQYLLRGGKMILALDAFSKVAPVYGIPPYDYSSPLYKLGEALGITMEKNKTVADLTAAHNVYVRKDYGRLLTSDMFWIDLKPQSFNRESAIMSPLTRLSFHSAGSLNVNETAGLAATPLITSSIQAMLADISPLELDTPLEEIKNRFKPGNTPLLIAARIQGTFNSAYEKAPELQFDAQKKNQKEHLSSSIAPTDVIVISDSDFLYDHFWNFRLNNPDHPVYGSFAENGDFIINAIDELMGQNALNALRNRTNSFQAFTGIEENRREAIAKYSLLNSQLSEAADKAKEAIKIINEVASSANRSLTISDIQNIEILQKSIDEIAVGIRHNNAAMQNEIKAYTNTVINLNLFTVPGLIALVCVFRLFRRKKHAS